MKLKTLAQAVSLIFIALPVAAQDVAADKKDTFPAKLEKIEVTGSSTNAFKTRARLLYKLSGRKTW